MDPNTRVVRLVAEDKGDELEAFLTEHDIDFAAEHIVPADLALSMGINSQYRFTLLQFCVDFFRFDCAIVLLNAGADPNGSPLHTAIYQQDAEFVDLLISNEKFDVNAECGPNRSALITAASKYDFDLMLFLIEEAKCDVNLCNSSRAADWMNFDALMVLLHQSVEVEGIFLVTEAMIEHNYNPFGGIVNLQSQCISYVMDEVFDMEKRIDPEERENFEALKSLFSVNQITIFHLDAHLKEELKSLYLVLIRFKVLERKAIFWTIVSFWDSDPMRLKKTSYSFPKKIKRN
jgi:hypothetical protein